MTDTVYTVGQLKTLLLPVFLRNDVRKAILFGSYVSGAASPKSDIDLYVDSGLRGLDFFGLLEEVVQVLDKDVDLIEKSDVIAGSLIDKEISSSGVLLYEK